MACCSAPSCGVSGSGRPRCVVELIFACFHTYEVATLAGRTHPGRRSLRPRADVTACSCGGADGSAAGMIVHALFNGLALVVLIAMNT